VGVPVLVNDYELLSDRAQVGIEVEDQDIAFAIGDSLPQSPAIRFDLDLELGS
jgi:hypothetical protein